MLRVGIDVGGTFTDVVAIDDESGTIENVKIPSTPKNPAQGVLEAFSKFPKEKVTLVAHATTLATNALLGQTELNLPKTAIITTRGFRDVIEIGRQRRAELYNLFFQKPKQLVPRRYRFEARERIDSYGHVVTPLIVDDTKTILDEIKSENIEAVAICFLNSYINQEHELKVKESIKSSMPNLYTCCSSEVAREYREYERFSTAVVNVMLMPIVSSYLGNLVRGLHTMKTSAPLIIMQSNGGMASVDYVSSRPASIIESGPAAGVVASVFYSYALGLDNVISFDMGGTTAKAGAVRGGVVETTSEYEVAGTVHKGRITKGSGYPVRGSIVDLAECSAGGGTIAGVDDGGALRVGPLSAGACPGPACYALGGADPTVTDANLVLGRLNPKYLLNGEKKIRIDLAKKAMEERICERLGLSVVEAALGILEIVNSEMAKILRMVSVERGYDPADFTTIAFGGAGPMHVCALADDIGVRQVVIPPNPGLFSALGLLVSDFKYEAVRAVMTRAQPGIEGSLEATFTDLEKEVLRAIHFFHEWVTTHRYVEMRYIGQSYELLVPIDKPITHRKTEEAIRKFHQRHEDVYGYSTEDSDVEVVNARVAAVRKVEKPKLRTIDRGNACPPTESIIEKRNVFFEDANRYVECPIFNRQKLKAGNVVRGPAIIEQYDSTTVVYQEWIAEIDDCGNILLRR